MIGFFICPFDVWGAQWVSHETNRHDGADGDVLSSLGQKLGINRGWRNQFVLVVDDDATRSLVKIHDWPAHGVGIVQVDEEGLLGSKRRYQNRIDFHRAPRREPWLTLEPV